MVSPSMYISHEDAEGVLLHYRTTRNGFCPYLIGNGSTIIRSRLVSLWNMSQKIDWRPSDVSPRMWTQLFLHYALGANGRLMGLSTQTKIPAYTLQDCIHMNCACQNPPPGSPQYRAGFPSFLKSVALTESTIPGIDD